FMGGNSRRTCASSAGRSLQAQPDPWLKRVSLGAFGYPSDSAGEGPGIDFPVTMRLLRLGFVTLLSAACSTTPAITVVATPATVAGDGVSTITVTAKPTEGGSPVDTTVHFTLEVSGVADSRTFAQWDGGTG